MAKNANTYSTFNIHEATPRAFYQELDREFHFDYDPCPLSYSPDKDGLTERWGRRVYVNPPYGKEVRKWIHKAMIELTRETELVVFLLPAYTDVKWFHELVLPNCSEIRFIKGRLKFGDHKDSAPFASMIVVFQSESSGDALAEDETVEGHKNESVCDRCLNDGEGEE